MRVSAQRIADANAPSLLGMISYHGSSWAFGFTMNDATKEVSRSVTGHGRLFLSVAARGRRHWPVAFPKFHHEWPSTPL